MNNEIYFKADIEGLLKNDRKGAKRQMQIANRAIELLAAKGGSGFSFEVLAKKCRITRTLIYRYFPTYESLIAFLSVLIRYRFQELVIARMKQEKTPREMLLAYLKASLEWVEIYPHDAAVWLVYFHQCTLDKKMAQHHANLVDTGTLRIIQLLQLTSASDSAPIQAEKMAASARLLQFMITGYLTARATESRKAADWKLVKEALIASSMAMISGAP